MLRHVVMFRWADTVDAAHIDATAAALDALPSAIPEIRSYVHGPDAGLADTNYDYALVADFDDEGGFLVYRDHPDHRAFIDSYVVGAVESRVAVQYAVG